MTSVTRAEETASNITVTPSEAPELAAPVDQAIATPSYAASYLSLLLFYLPLGFSGIMMTLDLPIVNGVLNRFPNPNTSVAALSVAFSLALVYEASHISMIDLSTALSTDQRTFRMLQRFYVIMAGVLLVGASIIAFSPLYDLIVRGVMNIPPEVAEAVPVVARADWLAAALPGGAHQARPSQARGCRGPGQDGGAHCVADLLRLAWFERGANRACGHCGAGNAGERHS
jgi:hypothetical protein